MDSAFFVASETTRPEVVDFVVVNTALHEIIGHGLLRYLLRIIRQVCSSESLTSAQNDSIDLHIKNDTTPPRKIQGMSKVQESGLAIECMLTDGFELTLCGKPGRRSTRSIVHAACINARDGEERSRWLIDDDYITATMADLPRYFSSLRGVKNHLQRAAATDHVLCTRRSCSFEGEEKAFVPGLCRRRVDFSSP